MATTFLTPDLFKTYFQVFEVLHYLGSCILKMIKSKLMKRKKSTRSASTVTIVDRKDEDPFLASIKRSSQNGKQSSWNKNNNSEGEILIKNFIQLILCSERKPCLPASDQQSQSHRVNSQNSDNSSHQNLDNNSSQVLSESVRSLQVKYTDSKKPYK